MSYAVKEIFLTLQGEGAHASDQHELAQRNIGKACKNVHSR